MRTGAIHQPFSVYVVVASMAECFTSTSFLYHLILAGGLLHLELHVRLTGLPINGSFPSVSQVSDKLKETETSITFLGVLIQYTI